jgi:ATP-dependent RNA helicase RhlE
MLQSFSELNLSAPLLNALEDMGLTQPTPIQEKAFSVIMSGRDVVGIAQTGTGKTLAYLLPILRNFSYSKQNHPRVIILVPTRELVIQMVGELTKITKYMNIRIAGVYGGTNINTQAAAVGMGVDIVVGTPGRLMDLGLSRALLLSGVRQLVIDEVDEMLSLGFRAQLTTIFDLLPKRRQNLLFSATMTEEVDQVLEVFFNNPELIEVIPMGTPLEQIRQSAYKVPNFMTKMNLLVEILKTDETTQKVLIFGATKRMADTIFEHLEASFPKQFGVVHADKSQNFRMNSVKAFQKNSIRGLIATDLFARGLDVTDITHVINVDTPKEAETYIHRIGRTGRADSAGAAITMITEKEEIYQTEIEALMKIEIPILLLPESVAISNELILDEVPVPAGKNYLPPTSVKRSKGAFHEKLDKNKKVNRGNKAINMKRDKYKKPIRKQQRKTK